MSFAVPLISSWENLRDKVQVSLTRKEPADKNLQELRFSLYEEDALDGRGSIHVANVIRGTEMLKGERENRNKLLFCQLRIARTHQISFVWAKKTTGANAPDTRNCTGTEWHRLGGSGARSLPGGSGTRAERKAGREGRQAGSSR